MTVGDQPKPGGAVRPRLLAVDDDAQILGIMCALLGRAYEVVVAHDGEEALRMALADPPDMILTDIDMPKMTGRELVRRVRQESSLDAVPVIVLTGTDDDDVRVDLLRNGAQDFVGKPFSGEELRVRIANLLRVKQARELLQAELQSREHDIGALVAEVAARRAALEGAVETAHVARDMAERASQAKSAFLALVSHELRTPLAVLGLTLDRWRRYTVGAGAEVTGDLERMATALRRLIAMVDGVIDYTTVQSGRLAPRPVRTDLSALFAGLRLEFEPQIEAKGLRFEIDVAEEARVVTVDPRIVRLILSSLIENGIKFTDAGFVRLRAGIDDGLVLTVSDSGRGIDRRDAERVFEPFEHGERIDHKSVPGVGLGLALVHDLVDALGGRVTLVSENGVGSTFTITLPCERAEGVAA